MTDVRTNGSHNPAERISAETGNAGMQKLLVSLVYHKDIDLANIGEKENTEIIQSPIGDPSLQQQLYSTNGNYPRPLNRVDSRSNFIIRPGYPNPPPGVQFRPPPNQGRPPQPGGQQFVQRPPLLQRPPIPGGQQPYGQPPPRPLIQNVQPGLRPGTPFPRPQGPQPRPPGIYPQKSFPAPGSPRPPISEDIYKVQNLDTPEYIGIRQDDLPISSDEKPSMAAMKNRSYSLNTSSEPSNTLDDRRKSVSSIGSNEEKTNGRIEDLQERPESRTSMMNKINEDEVDDSPNNKSPMSNDNSIDNLSQKSNFSLSPQPSSILETQIEQKPDAMQESFYVDKDEEVYRPQSRNSEAKSPQPPSKSPEKPTHLDIQSEDVIKSTRKSPEPMRERKTPDNTRKTPDIYGRKTPDIHGRKTPDSGLRKTPDGSRKTLDSARTRKISSGRMIKSPSKSEGDNDSGVDESTQGNDQSSNGDHCSPRKPSGKSTDRFVPSPNKNRSFSRGAKSPNPKSPDSAVSSTPAEKKKVPMNKVQVGSAPSPNLKVVKSKIGSLQNATHRPGGGNIKIESKKLDFTNTSSRIAAKNDTYSPGGGDKKIQQQKLQWQAKSKIGSLENATHKPKGGDKKIETVKLDFKDKAKPKVGSKDNMKHTPGGGDVKSEEYRSDRQTPQIPENIETKKIELNVSSKVGSLNNVKYKPGGGDKKIFDDKEYLRQMSGLSGDNRSMSGSQTSLPSQQEAREPVSDENLNKEH